MLLVVAVVVHPLGVPSHMCLQADVASSIPPKKEVLLYVGMTTTQKVLARLWGSGCVLLKFTRVSQEVYRNILRRDFDAIAGSTGLVRRGDGLVGLPSGGSFLA